jgi:prepilin-type N-terminal cleavage/methylation domain-containing protein
MHRKRRPKPHRLAPASVCGYSLLEVLVALAILLAGVVAIVQYFPRTLSASAEAAFVSEASMFAQMKSEEIRRDDDTSGTLVAAIAARTTPTDPIPFTQEPNLTYSFSGVSLIDPVDDPGDSRDDTGVARVIIRYAPDYKPTQEVVYELRFGY